MRDRTHNKCPSCGYQHDVGVRRSSCYDCGGSMVNPDPRSARIAELEADLAEAKEGWHVDTPNIDAIKSTARNDALEEAIDAVISIRGKLSNFNENWGDLAHYDACIRKIRSLKTEVK